MRHTTISAPHLHFASWPVVKARLPQARIRPLPSCGHVPMTDSPALVADILVQGSGRLAGQPA